MLPLVCNDAVAILFMFDLSRKSTLNSIKEWYRQARGFNKTAIPFLVGTKFDVFAGLPKEDQEEITKQVGAIFALSIHLPTHQHRQRDSQRLCTLLSSSAPLRTPFTYRKYSKLFSQRLSI